MPCSHHSNSAPSLVSYDNVRLLRQNCAMTVRVDVSAEVLEWALERSGRSEDDFWSKSNPRERFDSWLAGTRKPTYKQLQEFARRTYTPFGWLLLPEPVEEKMPVADFRTLGGNDDTSFSANLLDAIYDCQARLDWWREHRLISGGEPPSFLGTMSVDDDPGAAASVLTAALSWSAQVRRSAGSWENALAELRDRAETAGVLVVISGVVGSGGNRPLHVEEFRGFALVDSGDSLVFINGKDAKAAQIFTLVHELAHVLLGEEGVSNLAASSVREVEVERWCNRVAAEFLMPETEFREQLERESFERGQIDNLATHFRVSGQAIIGRFRELGFISWDRYFEEIRIEKQRVEETLKAKPPGGDFYKSKPVQLSKRFTEALVGSALEGHTPYSEAFELLGIRKSATFDTLAQKLGIA